MTSALNTAADLLTADEQAFRQQVCQLLCEESTRELVARCRRMPPGDEPGLLEVYRQLGERGWLAVHWPRRHGGLDGSIVQKWIVTEEMIRHGVPELVHTLGIDLVGQAISLYGTKSQQDRLLPSLARGESTANILFSEQETGSDLSALQTRAEPDGDGWRLYGRKLYNMKAHLSDFALCAARTSPSGVKFHGITLFIVPLRGPGVVVKPAWNITDEQFGDVVLDGIWVGPDDVLGDVDDGWQVVNQVLGLERTGIEYATRATRLMEALLRHAADTGRLEHPDHGQRLMALEARVRAARLLAWRCVRNLSRESPDEVHSAIAKWYSTEIGKQLSSYALEVSGLPGTLDARDGGAPVDGVFDAAYREAPGLTLASGTSEIMLYLIAGSRLGLQ
ncbi:MAG: acyl-CoA dehydrogenase family protein [Micromonosporaceae bacterium]